MKPRADGGGGQRAQQPPRRRRPFNLGIHRCMERHRMRAWGETERDADHGATSLSAGIRAWGWRGTPSEQGGDFHSFPNSQKPSWGLALGVCTGTTPSSVPLDGEGHSLWRSWEWTVQRPHRSLPGIGRQGLQLATLGHFQLFQANRSHAPGPRRQRIRASAWFLDGLLRFDILFHMRIVSHTVGEGGHHVFLRSPSI